MLQIWLPSTLLLIVCNYTLLKQTVSISYLTGYCVQLFRAHYGCVSCGCVIGMIAHLVRSNRPRVMLARRFWRCNLSEFSSLLPSTLSPRYGCGGAAPAWAWAWRSRWCRVLYSSCSSSGLWTLPRVTRTCWPSRMIRRWGLYDLHVLSFSYNSHLRHPWLTRVGPLVQLESETLTRR